MASMSKNSAEAPEISMAIGCGRERVQVACLPLECGDQSISANFNLFSVPLQVTWLCDKSRCRLTISTREFQKCENNCFWWDGVCLRMPSCRYAAFSLHPALFFFAFLFFKAIGNVIATWPMLLDKLAHILCTV